MPLRIGDTVGEYRILEELGAGGAGRVYRAEHTLTRRQEALKILSDGRPHNDDQARRFLREIQLQASLHHPHIAAVHHAFWAGEDLVMAMELVHGDPLPKLLEKRALGLKEAIDLVCQVLDALGHAHERGVVHRDVSASNIIVAADGSVKLTDFGLAKTPADLRLTETGAMVGTLFYASPEQVRSSPVVDARSDLYSCGVVLYELAAGRKPFTAETPFALMQAHVNEEPAPPSSVRPGLPPALDRVILRALAKDPAARFPSAKEFRRSLEAMVAAPARFRRSPLRAAIWLLGTAMAAVGAFGGWRWASLQDTRLELAMPKPPKPPASALVPAPKPAPRAKAPAAAPPAVEQTPQQVAPPPVVEQTPQQVAPPPVVERRRNPALRALGRLKVLNPQRWRRARDPERKKADSKEPSADR